jgi:hypothetical protein
MNAETARRLKEEIIGSLIRYDNGDDEVIIEVGFIATGDFGVSFDRSPTWQIWR